MSEKVQNRILFWALALVPLIGLWVVARVFGSFWFVGFLIFYSLIYRPTLDTQRLISLNVIEEKDAWRFYIPFAVDQIRYLRILWLG